MLQLGTCVAVSTASAASVICVSAAVNDDSAFSTMVLVHITCFPSFVLFTVHVVAMIGIMMPCLLHYYRQSSKNAGTIPTQCEQDRTHAERCNSNVNALKALRL